VTAVQAFLLKIKLKHSYQCKRIEFVSRETLAQEYQVIFI